MMTEGHKGSVQMMNAADEILGPALARGQGNDIAILFNDEKITYAELNSSVNRFGNALKPYLNKGDRALLVLKDSPTFVAAYLGIVRIGAVAIGLNTRSAAKDLAFIIDDSGANVLLLDEEFLPLYNDAIAVAFRRPALVAVRGAARAGMMMTIDELVRDASPELASEPMHPDDMAFWMYTSGTTGTPKGAIHRHGAISVGDPSMEWFGMAPGERIYSSSKLFFAYGLAHVLIGGLRFGATIILYEDFPDSASFAQIMNRYRPTIVLAVPTMYRNLLRDGYAKQPAFQAARLYLSSGEALPEGILNRWNEETGLPILNGLGTSETIYWIVGSTPTSYRAGASGKPVSYIDFKLLDDKEQPVTTPNTPGVLWVKAGCIFCAYWQQPDKTAAALRNGWFRTGDVFSFDADGWWHHQGRGDDQLKVSGQWVNPMEIEECAVTIPGITDAGVIGLENSDGLVRLTLFLATDGRDGNVDLKKAVQEKLLCTLSLYKCPRTVHFIEAIPRTATGKLQRYRLRQMAAELTNSAEMAKATSA